MYRLVFVMFNIYAKVKCIHSKIKMVHVTLTMHYFIVDAHICETKMKTDTML